MSDDLREFARRALDLLKESIASGVFDVDGERLAKDAVDQAGREIPVKLIVVGVRGEILQETELVYN